MLSIALKFLVLMFMEVQSPQPSQRPVAISCLVLANLVLAMGLVLSAFLAPGLFRTPMPVILIVVGILAGQLLWITLWASFSEARLYFRWGLLCAAVSVGTLGFALLPPYVVQLWYGTPLQQAFKNVPWMHVTQEFWRDAPPCLAFALAMYAILLPYRRLRGISVGAGPTHERTDSQGRQFRIIDLMVFSFIVAAPLAIIRVCARGEHLPTFLLFFGLLTAGGLLLGIPVFIASLAGRRALLWTPLSIGFVLTMGWIFTECTFWIYGSAGGLAVDFRVWLATLLPAAMIICSNNFCLQVLGIRLHLRNRVAKASSSG